MDFRCHFKDASFKYTFHVYFMVPLTGLRRDPLELVKRAFYDLLLLVGGVFEQGNESGGLGGNKIYLQAEVIS